MKKKRLDFFLFKHDLRRGGYLTGKIGPNFIKNVFPIKK